MGKGALRPFFKGHSLKKEKEHEKKEVDKMLCKRKINRWI